MIPALTITGPLQGFVALYIEASEVGIARIDPLRDGRATLVIDNVLDVRCTVRVGAVAVGELNPHGRARIEGLGARRYEVTLEVGTEPMRRSWIDATPP